MESVRYFGHPFEEIGIDDAVEKQMPRFARDDRLTWVQTLV